MVGGGQFLSCYAISSLYIHKVISFLIVSLFVYKKSFQFCKV